MRDVLPALELRADTVICDPPYNAGKSYGKTTNDRQDWPDWCAWWDGCLDVLTAAAPDVFAFLSQTAMRHYLRHGAHEPDWIMAWSKPLSLAVCAMPFMPHWEPILYWGKTRKKDGAFWNSDVITANVTRNEWGHPTEKPLPLMQTLVSRLTEPGDLVIDAFAGSGTTLVACRQLERRCVGVEINPDYCATIARRLDTEAPLLDRLAAIEQGSLAL